MKRVYLFPFPGNPRPKPKPESSLDKINTLSVEDRALVEALVNKLSTHSK
jgi:hypothetical protein